jgi:glycosyltransferase involved in cell wall biosynthesis
MLVSIIIRTYNEETYLDRLIEGINIQISEDFETEIVVVDSGSTDSTLQIAERGNCRVIHIKKSDFSFGRSLNLGCEFANGDYLVFISGHCIPSSKYWLKELVSPLIKGACTYAYGRQLGHETTKYSECRLFDKHFPVYSKMPQSGFFCNNANAAISKKVWERFRFDEELSGLEDMDLAKKIVACGGDIGYVADAPVFHIHNESWQQVKTRYEREAYALKSIMPEIHFSMTDFIKYFIAGVFEDSRMVIKEKRFLSEFKNILLFRLMHYWGTFLGNHEHRKLSKELKYKYFYPRDLDKVKHEKENSGIVADESK